VPYSKKEAIKMIQFASELTEEEEAEFIKSGEDDAGVL
jgi:hypothetical protein